MRVGLLLVCGWMAAQAQVVDMPKGVRVSTWVREDLFAGFLDGDMVRFERGAKKLERILTANPKAVDAVAWRGGVEMLHAVRAHEAGDAKGFETMFAKAKATQAEATEMARSLPMYQVGLHAITGGTYAVFSDRLPEAHRRYGWMQVRTHYAALLEAQKDGFEQLPVHLRGEVMAGLAQGAQRTGDVALARRLTQEIVDKLPNTPYAVFGKRWLDKPETMAKSKLTCSTCHDAGRLEPTLARLAR